MTSSLRNSLHRRNHKERAQLVGRNKLGLLEKHKDYVQRARDYHSKRDRIKRLKVKAAERNKDEFYFGMKNSKTIGGVHVQSRGNPSLPTDMVKVLKTQDANYIRAVRNKGKKRIAALREQLTSLADLVRSTSSSNEEGHQEEENELNDEELETLRQAGILPGKAGGKKKRTKHIIFVEDEKEALTYQPPSVKSPISDGNVPESPTEVDLGWVIASSAKKGKQVSKTDEDDLAMSADDDAEQHVQPKTTKTAMLKELAARLTRDTALRYTERELQMQTLMMGKGARRKTSAPELVDGPKDEEDSDEEFSYGRRRRQSGYKEEPVYKPRVYKWKPERKK
ncbi:hypothetical protein FRC02_009613 [Tulasnella sp. 418]|nr:hypothetical protein FRC02_009613 [Tulasnella sp. 418]